MKRKKRVRTEYEQLNSKVPKGLKRRFDFYRLKESMTVPQFLKTLLHIYEQGVDPDSRCGVEE